MTRKKHDSIQFITWKPSGLNGYKSSCCFNHVIGLPVKGNKVHPLYDYERMLLDCLETPSYLNSKNIHDKQPLEVLYPQKVKHVACLKAGGLGISELCLRWIAWKCLVNDDLKGSQVVVFTGPRLELAVSLISRLKSLFKPFDITFTDKETVCNLNNVRIEAFPSHHADSARGLPSPSIIFADEFSFVPDNEIDNIMDIMLRNIPKSNPYLLAISTPNKPNDAMDRLLKEPFETTPWKVIKLDWTYGVNQIYSQEDIDKIKNSRSFDREFCLKFAGVQVNVISPTAIDCCLQLGEEMNKTTPIDDWSIQTSYVMGIDAGYGSSNTAITVSRFVNGKVQLIYAKEFTRPNFSDILDTVWNLKNRCPSNCLQVQEKNAGSVSKCR